MDNSEAFQKFVSEQEASLYRSVAAQIAAAAKEHGYISLIAYPALDSAIGAAIVASFLRRNRVDFEAAFSLTPPPKLDAPSVLIGYPTEAIGSIQSASKPSALIGYGKIPRGITPLSIVAFEETSAAALAVAVLSELAIVGDISTYSVVSSLWLRLDRGKRGELEGVPRAVVEMLKIENKVEEVFSIRLFRWNTLPTEEALSITLDPYLPGITGSSEAALKFLREDPRLAVLEGKVLSEAQEQAMAVLGEKLYNLIKKASRLPRKPTEVVGMAYYSTRPVEADLRETSYMFSAYAHVAGIDRLLGLSLDERGVYAAAHYMYRMSFETIIDDVEKLLDACRTGRLKRTTLAGVRSLEIDAGFPPIAARVLSQLGCMESGDLPLFVDEEGGTVAIAESVQKIFDYKELSKLQEQGCLEYIDGSMYVKIRRDRCG
ncbi:MAG: hypothetical protein ABWW70_05100 [Thermoproteota archaeon]